MNFQPSSAFESWITQLAQGWMGAKAKRIWGAFSAVLGDQAVDWATQALLEHLPQYASVASNALTGSERQIVRGKTETDAGYAFRLVLAVPQWKMAGRPLGLLTALYFGGYTSAVLCQQNGVYHYLTGDPTALLQAIVRGDDISTWPATYQTGPLNVLIAPLTSSVTPGRSIPAGTPWWTLDSDTDHCSRFTLLLPNQPSFWMHKGTATFVNASSAPIVWSQPFGSGVVTYSTVISAPETTDGFIDFATTALTQTGATVLASDAFTGTVDVLAWASGENPLCCPSTADLTTLRNILNLWRPAKAMCWSINALLYGKYWGWPVRNWSSSDVWTPSEVATFAS